MNRRISGVLVACAVSLSVTGNALAADPIFTGNGYFLVHLNSVTWKVTPNGQATRTDIPKFSYPLGAAYGNGHWLAWNSGFSTSTDGVFWKAVNLGHVMPTDANIAATQGKLFFSDGKFYLTTAMTNQLCSSASGVNWDCKPAFSTRRTTMSQVQKCGNTLYRFAEITRSTPTGTSQQTEVVIRGAGGLPQKFYVAAPYESSACFGNKIVFYSGPSESELPFAVTSLDKKVTRIEKIRNVNEVLSAAGNQDVGLLVIAPNNTTPVLIIYKNGSFHPEKTAFEPQSVAYEDGTFLATSDTKMYISRNGVDWKQVR